MDDDYILTTRDLAKTIITIAPNNPALPTTHPRRRYIITPRMVSTSGVKTPAKVPNRPFKDSASLSDGLIFEIIFFIKSCIVSDNCY